MAQSLQTDRPNIAKQQKDEQEPRRAYTLSPTLRQLYPASEPFNKGMLPVDDIHTLSWQASGNPKGVPVVFLHGGPGAGTQADDARFFDPQHYCIYTFDQRGAGKSTPYASLTRNTTWDLVEDLEKLRKHFNIDKWHIFGGSWGSTYALTYAQTYPQSVLSLVLRGIFTFRKSEMYYLFQHGTSFIFPEAFEQYRDHIPKSEQDDLPKAYYKRLTSDDEQTRLDAAKHFVTFELSASQLYLNQKALAEVRNDPASVLAFACTEAHYFAHQGWLEEGQLLRQENVDKIRHIPAILVQGRYDVMCPPTTAYELHKRWPESQLVISPDAGHDEYEPGNIHQLVSATDKMRSIKT